MNSKQMIERFDILSPREKWMTTAATLLVIWTVWDNTVYQALHQQQLDLTESISALEGQLLNQQQLAARIQRGDQLNPNLQKLEQIRQSVHNLKQQLNGGDKRFVPPQLMAEALRDILRQHGDLKLIKLETHPPEPFGADPQRPVWVYRHTLELTVQGSFFSTLDYLKALENLTWRIHWDDIDYQVKQYPLAETRIKVYTLSFEKDWLGA